MADKCETHDQCMGRIQDTISDLRDEIHQLGVELKEMLHDNALFTTKLMMRLEQCENELRNVRASRDVNWRVLAARTAFGLVEKALLVLLAMAYYAHRTGFGG